MVTIEEARDIVAKAMPKNTSINGEMEYSDSYMFLAVRDDPLEGRFDPFVKVDKATGKFSDFSPQDYPDPLLIINSLLGKI